MKKKKTVSSKAENINLFQKIGIFFFDHKPFTIILWVSLVVFGALSYSTLMKREGFPSINIPVGIVRVQTFSDSATSVDQTYAQPIIDILN